MVSPFRPGFFFRMVSFFLYPLLYHIIPTCDMGLQKDPKIKKKISKMAGNENHSLPFSIFPLFQLLCRIKIFRTTGTFASYKIFIPKFYTGQFCFG